MARQLAPLHSLPPHRLWKTARALPQAFTRTTNKPLWRARRFGGKVDTLPGGRPASGRTGLEPARGVRLWGWQLPGNFPRCASTGGGGGRLHGQSEGGCLGCTGRGTAALSKLPSKYGKQYHGVNQYWSRHGGLRQRIRRHSSAKHRSRSLAKVASELPHSSFLAACWQQAPLAQLVCLRTALHPLGGVSPILWLLLATAAGYYCLS